MELVLKLTTKMLFISLSLPVLVVTLLGIPEAGFLLLGVILGPFAFLVYLFGRGGVEKARIGVFFGCLLPLLPWCGGGAISIVFLSFYVLGVIARDRRTPSRFMLPLVLLLSTWGLLSLVVEFGNIEVLLQEGKFEALGGSPVFQQISFALSLFLFGSLLEIWSRDDDERDAFLHGLLVGGAGAVGISVVHALSRIVPFALPLPFPQQLPVWDQLDRPVGTFTDPNAFGVFCAIFLLLVLVKAFCTFKRWEKIACVFLVPLLLLGGVLSESRTFFLLLGVCLVSCLGFLFSQRKTRRIGFVVFGVILLLSLFGFLVFPAELSGFIGDSRFGNTVTKLLSGNVEVIQDRLQFSTLAWLVFLHAPVTGVGLYEFSGVMTSFAHFYGVPLGLWIDNPNNAYLGLLAELGLVGIALLFFSLYGVKFRFRNEPTSLPHIVLLSGAIAFFISLIVGPHYLFPEVLFAFGLMISLLYRLEERVRFQSKGVVIALFAVPLIYLAVQKGEFGVHHWERDDRGELFRWTARSFQTWSNCSDFQAELLIRNGGDERVSVSFEGRIPPISLASGEVRTVQIPCKKHRPFRGRTVRGEVVGSFIASDINDNRLLGIQLLQREPEEIVEAQLTP